MGAGPSVGGQAVLSWPPEWMRSPRELHVSRNLAVVDVSVTPFRKGGEPDFDAMDAFMSGVNEVLKEQGSRAVRIFPPAANVPVSFADRLATEAVCGFS